MTRAIETLLTRAVDRAVFPGAVWAVGDPDGVRAQGACGLLDPTVPDDPMRADTVFDLASLTKIVAVWSCIGTLWEAGALNLDRPLTQYLPDLDGYDLGGVTAQQLLTHTAGVPLRANLEALYGTERTAVERGILRERLRHRPGQVVEYTDRAALVLGILAERLSGLRLDVLSREYAWDALHMRSTAFGPVPAADVARCAPTEWDEPSGRHLRGTPHDYSARLLGVCGSAGVFSDVGDLGRFLRYLLAPDQAPRRPGFGPAWVKESLKVQTGTLHPTRGLFWHPAPAPAGVDGSEVWAHFGFTGTAMWVSLRRRRWAVLLTNKLYYTRDSHPILDVRTSFARLAFDL
ncbi:serine hydrolase domain-containing protein [Jiangella mangrovi]|uniref:CubicO group peptidase (Beta-lactamase class C family) n=1 Tax=Jiangella mangrovi TaxID=1524084 RepID=A0A7W9GP25_9ACTN|nr:serine hydrolase domain-containing protein [Jiangella mangrovi]MBB5787427.1 CubicO group peptidase (beta-lactamase class C family) [Jiangella mangrovi]